MNQHEYELRNTGPYLWSLGYEEGGLFLAVEDFTDYSLAQLALSDARQF